MEIQRIEFDLVIKKWINVPFLYRGKDKYGCDCFGLIYGIYKEVLNEKQFTIIENIYQDILYGNNILYYKKNVFEYLKHLAIKINIDQLNFGEMILYANKKYNLHFALNIGNNHLIEANYYRKVTMTRSFQKSELTEDCSFWLVI